MNPFTEDSEKSNLHLLLFTVQTIIQSVKIDSVLKLLQFNGTDTGCPNKNDKVLN